MFACLPRKHMNRCLLAVMGLLSWLVAAEPARAQIGSSRYSSIVVEASNGTVLEAVSAEQLRHPASLTKMMTLYLTFEALRDRRINTAQPVPISAHAAAQQPSKLGLLPGMHLTVDEAILGLVTKSANDAAAALGELLGGTEERFAQMMTLRARALGMTNTTFQNASGLPDPEQWSTAHDLALLARHLITDFPAYYGYFSTPSFTWHRHVIFNHDHMLQTYPGADGLKTGYTEASGHNLVTSAVRDGVRLIGVVLGAASNPERDRHMAVLLDQGFGELGVTLARKPVQTASRIAIIPAAHAAEALHPAPGRTKVSANWSVQVGTFASEAAARNAATSARKAAEAGEIRVEPVRLKGQTLWRAAVIGLSQTDAEDACSSRKKSGCMLIRPGQRQLASR